MSVRLSTSLAACAAAFIFIIIATACAAAGPEQWESYWKDRHDVEYFYDKDHVEYPSKGMIKVYRKRVFPEGSQQKEIVSLDEMNCKTLKYRSLELTVTGFDGTSETTNVVSPWIMIWGNTADESVSDALCPEANKPR
jgi:hypothetical protein